MLHRRFVIGLLAIILNCFTPIISSANAKSIVLNKTVITDFFKGVSIELGRPIVVSSKAGLFEISGEIKLNDPYKAIASVANKTNLIWYDDGSAIYVYASSELRNEFIPVSTEEEFEQIIKFLKLSKLYSQNYPIRYTKGAAIVAGPPMYLTVVKDAIKAYYNGLEAEDKPEPPKPVEIMKMYPLKNRFVSDMRYYIRGAEKIVDGALTILKRLISERSDEIKNVNVVADTLNNALYIKGFTNEVKALEALIEEIDIVREQIQLSLWIIDVDSTELKEIGTTLEGKISTDMFSIGLNGGSVILNQAQTLSFVGAVNFLETERKAKVLSRPVLITQNNTPAVIDTNETIYVKLIGDQEVSLKEITYGTILSVTPRVVKSSNGNDIEMMVEIEDGNQTPDLIDGLPNIRRSVISTVGRINDSQSLLLGGFVRKEVTNQTRGIPVLKDIPFIRRLFSMDVESSSSIMRLFMIEPKIIQDPAAEFHRSKIMNLQKESFVQKGKGKKVKKSIGRDTNSNTQSKDAARKIIPTRSTPRNNERSQEPKNLRRIRPTGQDNSRNRRPVSDTRKGLDIIDRSQINARQNDVRVRTDKYINNRKDNYSQGENLGRSTYTQDEHRRRPTYVQEENPRRSAYIQDENLRRSPRAQGEKQRRSQYIQDDTQRRQYLEDENPRQQIFYDEYGQPYILQPLEKRKLLRRKLSQSQTKIN